MKLSLPAVFAVDETRSENRIRLIGDSSTVIEGTVARFARGSIEGFLFSAADDGTETLIIPRSKTLPTSISRCVIGEFDLHAATVDLTSSRWLRHPILTAMAGRPFDYSQNLNDIRASWAGTFSYAQEDVSRK